MSNPVASVAREPEAELAPADRPASRLSGFRLPGAPMFHAQLRVMLVTGVVATLALVLCLLFLPGMRAFDPARVLPWPFVAVGSSSPSGRC